MNRNTPRFFPGQTLRATDLNRLALAAERRPIMLGSPPPPVPALMLGRVIAINGNAYSDVYGAGPTDPAAASTWLYGIRVYNGDQHPSRPGFTDMQDAAPEWREFPGTTLVQAARIGSVCLLAYIHGPEHGGEDTRGLVLLKVAEVVSAGDCAAPPP